MNITKISIISLFMLVFLIGCSTNTPIQETSKINNNIEISNYGNLLGYAYLKNGSELLKITTLLDNNLNDLEIIKIYESGFYPDYLIPNKSVICPIGEMAQKNYENQVICNSAFSTVSTGKTIFANTMMSRYFRIKLCIWSNYKS